MYGGGRGRRCVARSRQGGREGRPCFLMRVWNEKSREKRKDKHICCSASLSSQPVQPAQQHTSTMHLATIYRPMISRLSDGMMIDARMHRRMKVAQDTTRTRLAGRADGPISHLQLRLRHDCFHETVSLILRYSARLPCEARLAVFTSKAPRRTTRCVAVSPLLLLSSSFMAFYRAHPGVAELPKLRRLRCTGSSPHTTASPCPPRARACISKAPAHAGRSKS